MWQADPFILRRAVIFVGPSLTEPRPRPTGIEYRPPAIRGDLLHATQEGFHTIALVDGQFLQNLAVTPTEVRQVAELGIKLLGAASLGALRACESPRHMIGIGKVYDWFCQGYLNADDEVAGTYDPHTQQTIAYPLVIARIAAQIAVKRSVLDSSQAEFIIGEIASMPFYERCAPNIEAVLDQLGRPALTEQFLDILKSDEANVKRQDALKLIRAIAKDL